MTAEPHSYAPVGTVPTAALSLATPGDYLQLLKPRVMSLVVFTALVGMVAAPGPIESWPLALLSLFAIAVGAGASGALNMWWDADIDAVMTRTQGRPVPSGKVPKAEAAAFGGVLSSLAVWLLALSGQGYLGAALLAFTIFFYVVVYSMGLKRRTPQNIVIGGLAGALPPVVGWASVAGTAPLAAWLLVAVIFFWTPPHFWALSLVKSGDYEAANVPMMPNVRGAEHTRDLVWWYSVLLAPLAVTPALTDAAGWPYAILAALGGAEFLRRAWAVRRQGTDAACWALFRYSIFYLFGLFAVVLAEHWLGLHG